MNHSLLSVVCAVASFALLSQPSLAADQALAQQQAASKPDVAGNTTKRMTACKVNFIWLSDDITFRCGAFGGEEVTLEVLAARGWRIVTVWPWRDGLQLLAEER